MTEKFSLHDADENSAIDAAILERENQEEARQEEERQRLEAMSFCPYQMTTGGLHMMVETGKGEDRTEIPVRIATKFFIIGLARDPSSNEWARCLEFHDRDNVLHRVVVKDADLHGDAGAVAANLVRQGLRIMTRYRREFVEYLNLLNSDQRVTIVDRTGWHTIGGKSVFVLPDDTFGQPEGEMVVLNTTEGSPYASRGKLADWKKGIGRLTADHRLGVLAVSTSLAGPILNIAGQDGGGIHYRGPSSVGKTALARASASVWGPRAFMRSWRSTANGLEGAAVLSSDSCLVLDELGVIESREANAAVYQLAIGTGKQRARRDGGLRTPASWRTMVVSTGEISITAKIEEQRDRKAKAGQEIRILDIPADVGAGFGIFDSAGSEKSAGALADEILKSSEQYYGTAGPEFIRKVTELGEKAVKIVTEKVDAFMVATAVFGTEGQVRRAARRLALIACAGEMAIEFGIVPWKKGSATKAAEFALEQWIAARGGTEAAEILSAISAVRLFIGKWGDSRFEDMDLPSTIPVANRAGWRKGKGEQQFWAILPDVWKSEVCAGLDPVFAARALADRGLLDRDQTKLQKNHWISGRTVRAYTINSTIFGDLHNTKQVEEVEEVEGPIKSGTSCIEAEFKKPLGNGHIPPIPPIPPESDMNSQKNDAEHAPQPSPEDEVQASLEDGEDLGIPDFLQRTPKTEFRPDTLLTPDDEAFIQSGGFK